MINQSFHCSDLCIWEASNLRLQRREQLRFFSTSRFGIMELVTWTRPPSIIYRAWRVSFNCTNGRGDTPPPRALTRALIFFCIAITAHGDIFLS